MWPFRSKAQKKLDALQGLLNARLIAVDAAMKIFKLTTDEFERLQQSPDTEEWKVFKVAQSKHAYFANALLDDLKPVEDGIKRLRLASEIAVRSDPIQFATELIELEERLADTEKNVSRLGGVCSQMLQATGLDAT